MKTYIKDVLQVIRVSLQLSKMCLPIALLKNILEKLLPFVNIIYSARILDKLVILAEKKEVMINVYYMVALNLIGGLFLSFLTRAFEVSRDTINMKKKIEIAGKSLEIDFEQLESQRNMELLNKASEGVDSSGGISDFCDYLGKGIASLITIVYSTIILSSLFINRSLETTTFLTKFLNSPISTLVFIIVLVITLCVNNHFIQLIAKKSYQFYEDNAGQNRKYIYYNDVIEDYHIQKDIRLYGLRNMLNNQLDKYRQNSIRIYGDFCKLRANNFSYAIVANHFMIMFGYLFAGLKAVVGLISIGSVAKYVSSFTMISSAINQIINSYTNIDVQRKYLVNYFEYLGIESKKNISNKSVPQKISDIEFKNVSFRYPNATDLVLNNISFRLSDNKTVALVGKNGAGKSTIIKLLCRLYEPTEGEILINGINIKEYSYKEYIDLFSVVFQDFKLFSLPIAENIAVSKDYNEELIWNILKKVRINNQVERIPEQLQYQLYQSEKEGIEISGGEAQKLAIARALYKNGELVILDEPTSALDPMSEFEIYSQFNNLIQDKLTVFISHRMSSCKFCDEILVLDNGEIVQIGTHKNLLEQKDGLYALLWNAQAQNY